MAYNQNIPLANDEFSQSQPEIKDNFTEIKTVVDVNHETFGAAAAAQGMHKFVSLTKQGAKPGLIADVLHLYNKGNALCWENPAGDEIDFTTNGHAAAGWSRMPSGLLLKWGYNSATGYAAFPYPVGAGIPAFTAVYIVLLTPYGTGAGSMNREIRLQSYNNPLQFGAVGTRRYQNNDDTCEFTWLAIGV